MSGIRLDSYFLFWSNTVFLCDTVSQRHPAEAAGALTSWLMLEEETGRESAARWLLWCD